MSSLLIAGFFALASGRRVAITKPGASNKTWYCYYTTTIQTSEGDILPADLRIYSPIHDIVHPDLTVAFVIAKAFIPPHDTTFLDVLHLAICPGDPSSDDYEDSLPDCPFPWIFGVGHVPAKAETLADTTTRVFIVSHTEYVREAVRNTSITCAYDGNAPRWTNTPVPNPQACIQYFGICHSVLRSGFLRVNVESIVLNLAPLSSEPATTSTPTKRRKFQAVASASTSTKLISSVAAGNDPSSSMAPLQPISTPTTVLDHPATANIAGGSDTDPLTPIDETDANSAATLDDSDSSKAKGKRKARS